MIIFALFLMIPLIEIYLFIVVGGAIGTGTTLLLTVVTAILGAGLLKAQGISVMRECQEKLQNNAFPAREMFDGLCLLVAGAVLLTPGFFTDTIGFLLFTPMFRGFIYEQVKLRPENFRQGGFSGATFFDMEAEKRQQRSDETVIEAEYTEITVEKDTSSKNDHQK